MYVEHPLIKPDTVKLRRYQEAITSRAIEDHTLVVLPTGLGKTIIAVMVIAQRLHELPKSKILFLAPTKPLVVQHKKTFDDLIIGFNSVVLTGEEKIENRRELWENSQAIFATPQTIENDLLRNLSLKDVSLIVFDESHRAVGEYSYVYIAKKYLETASNPLVLGLTASPGSKKEKIDEVCSNLGIIQVEAKTESDRDVKEYVKLIDVKTVRVKLPEEFLRVKKKLESVLKDDLKLLKEGDYLKSADVRQVNKRTILELQAQIRKDVASGQPAYQYASLAASALKINHAIELLETQGVSSLDSYIKRMGKQDSKAVKRLLNDDRIMDAMSHITYLKDKGIEHPKLDKLVNLVKKKKGEKILIFTQYRDTVDKIIEKLNEADVLAHEFIGQAKKSGKGMSQKKQIETLEKFKEGKYDALVATSVAEEGLDIPKVDLVVFYEPIPSEIRAIQRRGRTGRSHTGEVVLLIAQDTRDEGYYWASYHKERAMRSNIATLKKKDLKNEKVKTKASGQKSLMEYTERQEENGMKIIIDNRETQLMKKLLKEKVDIELAQLQVGDYLLSDRVCVERKTAEDFLQSIIDGRLLSQAAELKRNFDIPIIIIEGYERLYTTRNIHPNAIRGALAALAIDFNIPVIPTENEEDTAFTLVSMAKREQEEDKRIVALRGEKKPFALREKQIYMIESLPNVSAVLARRMLSEFNSVENVITAGEKQLTKVEGIGDKKAAEIRNVIKSTYVRDKEDG